MVTVSAAVFFIHEDYFILLFLDGLIYKFIIIVYNTIFLSLHSVLNYVLNFSHYELSSTNFKFMEVLVAFKLFLFLCNFFNIIYLMSYIILFYVAADVAWANTSQRN
jgi:hypothetical protein